MTTPHDDLTNDHNVDMPDDYLDDDYIETDDFEPRSRWGRFVDWWVGVLQWRPARRNSEMEAAVWALVNMTQSLEETAQGMREAIEQRPAVATIPEPVVPAVSLMPAIPIVARTTPIVFKNLGEIRDQLIAGERLSAKDADLMVAAFEEYMDDRDRRVSARTLRHAGEKLRRNDGIPGDSRASATDFMYAKVLDDLADQIHQVSTVTPSTGILAVATEVVEAAAEQMEEMSAA